MRDKTIGEHGEGLRAKEGRKKLGIDDKQRFLKNWGNLMATISSSWWTDAQAWSSRSFHTV